MALRDFGKALLDHVANDGKVSREIVQMKYTKWEDFMQKREAKEQEDRDLYEADHQRPRQEKRAIYEQYISQKEEARLRYINAPPTAKRQAMEEWLTIKLPEEIRTKGVNTDFVYTQNRVRTSK